MIEGQAPTGAGEEDAMTARHEQGSSLLSVAFSVTRSQCVLTAAGDLTGSSAPALEAQIDQIVSAPDLDVVFDVTDLRRLDPSGVRILVEIDRHVRNLGRRLAVRGAGGDVAAALAGTPLDVLASRPAA